MIRIAAILALALALTLTACGGDDEEQPGVGDTVTTEGGATYKVVSASVAETASELDKALGTEQPGTGGFTLGPSTSYGEPVGVYVAVELETGGKEAPKGGKDGGYQLLGGDGDEYSSESFTIAFDIEDITKDGEGGEEESGITSTGIYDVPAEAAEGAQLQIEEAGQTYAIDLGI